MSRPAAEATGIPRSAPVASCQVRPPSVERRILSVVPLRMMDPSSSLSSGVRKVIGGRRPFFMHDGGLGDGHRSDRGPGMKQHRFLRLVVAKFVTGAMPAPSRQKSTRIQVAGSDIDSFLFRLTHRKGHSPGGCAGSTGSKERLGPKKGRTSERPISWRRVSFQA